MKTRLYSSNNKPIKKLVFLKLIKNNLLCNKKIIKIFKILKIILRYYFTNQKILFLGALSKISCFFKFIKEFQNISYMPYNVWVKGLLTNSFVFKALYFSKKRELFKFLLNFLPNYDIIINLGSYKNKELLKLIKQPILNFQDSLQKNSIVNAKLPNNNLVYFLIYQILLKFKHVK